MPAPAPQRTFSALDTAAPWLRHAFVERIPQIPVDLPRAEAMATLAPVHLECVKALGFNESRFFTAEQVHGAEVAVIGPDESGRTLPGVDALVTASPGAVLGIYTADCGPVYLVDPVRQVIALAHSGRKGTELGIVSATVAVMASEFGTQPEDVILQLGPCIRPPRYECDFAAEILAQARAVGLGDENIHDCGECTGSDLGRYYSYRTESGRTGRMLALLGIADR